MSERLVQDLMTASSSKPRGYGSQVISPKGSTSKRLGEKEGFFAVSKGSGRLQAAESPRQNRVTRTDLMAFFGMAGTDHLMFLTPHARIIKKTNV